MENDNWFTVEKMNKIVFLDIDGVLNSSAWNESHQDEIKKGILIDRQKVTLLASLVKKTGARIILHSGWRYWFDNKLKPLRIESEYLIEFLQQEGLSIEGVTPDLTTEEIRTTKKFSLVKADEILLWLKQNENVASWVVFDDLDLHNVEVEQYQVKTDYMVGLTYFDIEKAEEILTN